MNNIESPSDIDRARETFERAITAVGLHVTEVNKIDLASPNFVSNIKQIYA